MIPVASGIQPVGVHPADKQINDSRNNNQQIFCLLFTKSSCQADILTLQACHSNKKARLLFTAAPFLPPGGRKTFRPPYGAASHGDGLYDAWPPACAGSSCPASCKALPDRMAPNVPGSTCGCWPDRPC